MHICLTLKFLELNCLEKWNKICYSHLSMFLSNFCPLSFLLIFCNYFSFLFFKICIFANRCYPLSMLIIDKSFLFWCSLNLLLDYMHVCGTCSYSTVALMHKVSSKFQYLFRLSYKKISFQILSKEKIFGMLKVLFNVGEANQSINQPTHQPTG